ncbi:spore germination protein GerPE [Paenibacillus sp. CF384]|uniref:spore germination protein GerPE n=1 Tax=Paenibacillus sp. CF384 TaxID=1884382 RepID=UPI0008981466|nr:spore germination protein GerPE [Paenibacillus sp. CF384]SDW58093.1 spore germination protein PE [Paenibacillus sp. CF384]
MRSNPSLPSYSVENSDYPVRVSEVGGLYLTNVGSASVVQIGDRAEVNASLRALAVQRAADHAESGNVYFESYSIFDRPTPSWDPLGIASDDVPTFIKTTNCQPSISVGCIEVIAVSSAANVLIGNGLKMRAESRVKHIRQYARSIPTGSSVPASPC